MKHLCKGITEGHGISLRNTGPGNSGWRRTGQNDVAPASTVLATPFVVFANTRTIVMDLGEVNVAKQETCRFAPTGAEGAHANPMKNNVASLAKFHNARELERWLEKGFSRHQGMDSS